jgi:N utilization substance protein A
MNYDIIEALSQIAREKGVDLQILVDRLEASLLSAAKKKYGVNAQITVNFDRGRGGIEMWMTKTVVGKVSDRGLEMTAVQARSLKADASVGDEIVIPLDISEFGRNAIQAAKQMLIQGVREAERERVYSDFADKVGDVVRGVVQQVDRGNIVLKLDTAEAIIPAREVMHRDRFRQREMVRALVIKVDKEARGPQVILSRTHPDFLVKLFEAEVPEIADKVVEVKAVAREAGFRSKIAVMSHDSRIDAVGACVGIKGSRVQSIVKELGGERIDIVPWSTDPVVFVSRSLGPAKAMDARVDEENRKVTVVVSDDQLSLAIGKQGQNVRLAAKLTGWKIELHSESEFQAKTAAAEANVPIEELEGIHDGMMETLRAAGITTALDIETRGLEGLQEVEGLGENSAERLYGVALAALANARSEAAAKAAAAGVTEDEEAEAAPVFAPPRETEGPDLVPEAKTDDAGLSENGSETETAEAEASGADAEEAGPEGNGEEEPEPESAASDAGEDAERPKPGEGTGVAVEEGPTGS